MKTNFKLYRLAAICQVLLFTFHVADDRLGAGARDSQERMRSHAGSQDDLLRLLQDLHPLHYPAVHAAGALWTGLHLLRIVRPLRFLDKER